MLSGTRVRRGLSVLEADAVGELQTVELEAQIALAHCRRCGRRVRVLPCDVLPYKHYSVSVIAQLAGAYTHGWQGSLRTVAWGLLGERTPAHTTLHGWTEGLGAHVLGLPTGTFDGRAGGWPFSRVFAEAEARVPAVRTVWEAPVWVDERRYRSDGRRERLAAVAQVLALAHTVTGQFGYEALGAWRALTVRGSGSSGLRFPSRLLCTGIEQLAGPDRRESRARSPPRRRRCPIRTPSPPGASSKSPRSSMPASMSKRGVRRCANAPPPPSSGRGPSSGVGGARRRSTSRFPRARSTAGSPPTAKRAIWGCCRRGAATGENSKHPNRYRMPQIVQAQPPHVWLVGQSCDGAEAVKHPTYGGITERRSA